MYTKLNDPSNIDINEVKFAITIVEQGQLKAQAILQYKNLRIKGFRVVNSKYKNSNGDELWVQVPSYQLSGRFCKMFFIEGRDKEPWRQLEKKLLEAYKEKSEEFYHQKFKMVDSNNSNYIE